MGFVAKYMGSYETVLLVNKIAVDDRVGNMNNG